MTRQPAAAEIVLNLRAACPELTPAVDQLTAEWLRPVEGRLAAISDSSDEKPRSKHINDPVWRTFELEAHEVLLIDSPLLQRLRGVKQLGLANLVFPGANHDRFEHVCGTVQAAERMFAALARNSQRRRQTGSRHPAEPPVLEQHERQSVRLAALLHDVGHGPFSHAIEPVVATRYAADLKAFNDFSRTAFSLDSNVAIAELVSVLIVLSPTMARVFGSALFASLQAKNAADLQLRLAVMIMGARRHGQPAFMSAIISGQVDADKLDYMTRDALHSGMPIEFDTERLLWKLEVISCTPDNLPADQPKNREFAEQSPGRSYSDLGIAAAGVGALEQMLIGRAFLYDRLYHHHKVRAADAMAQRMLHHAIKERGRPFDLADLYQPVSDDTLIRLLAGDLQRPGLEVGSALAARLGKAILARDLYVRAFAFRASFHNAGDGEKDEKLRTAALAEAWGPVSTGLADLDDRIVAEAEIVAIAKRIASGLKDARMTRLAEELDVGHVVVDLAENRVKAVTINVHAEDGSLEAPNLFFDPARWSHVYDLQKRTGYVFCERRFVALIGLASKIFFFEKWGYAVSEKGDRLTKTMDAVKPEWIDALAVDGVIDDALQSILKRETRPRTFVHVGQVEWPQIWRNENSDLDERIVDDLRIHLPQGLSGPDRDALVDGIAAIAAFVASMHQDASFLGGTPNERDLQTALLRHLRAREPEVAEGTEFGGGETDVLFRGRLLIENKIIGRTAHPFSAKPEAGYQTNRYSVALCARVFVTLIAYQPIEAGAPIQQTDSINIEPLNGANRTAVNIKVVVPYGLPSPSKVKVPAQSRTA